MDDATYCAVRDCEGDAGADRCASSPSRADREVAGARWSYRRDIGRTRIVMMDSRAGRVLRPGQPPHGRPGGVGVDRAMHARRVRPPPARHVAARVPRPGACTSSRRGTRRCATGRGAGSPRALGEKMRQGLDLEHWAAFGESLRDLEDLLDRIASGRHGDGAGERRRSCRATSTTPTSPRVEFTAGNGDRAPVYQATCSPLRNPLDSRERRGIRAAMSRPAERIGGRSRAPRACRRSRCDGRSRRGRGSTTRWRRSSSTAGRAGWRSTRSWSRRAGRRGSSGSCDGGCRNAAKRVISPDGREDGRRQRRRSRPCPARAGAPAPDPRAGRHAGARPARRGDAARSPARSPAATPAAASRSTTSCRSRASGS